MTVYVQYHWESGTHVDIETLWNNGISDIANTNNNFLIGHPWDDNGVSFKINTDNIIVTQIEQNFNVMDVYVQYVEVEDNGATGE